MRVFTLVTAALAASVLASASAVAQNFDPAALQKSCPDMTYNQVGLKLADLVEKYEFSKNPEEADQQAISLMCPAPASAASAEARQPEATEANLVQEAMVPPAHFVPPHPILRPPPRRGMPPMAFVPHLPPPPPGGYGRRLPPVAMAGGYRERYHEEEHYRAGRRVVGAPGRVINRIVEHPLTGPGRKYRCFGATGEPSGGPGTGDGWCRQR